MKRATLFLVSVCGSILLTACGGGSSSDNTDSDLSKAIGDFKGTWSVTETIDGTACGDGVYNDNYNIEVTSQSGNSLTVSTNVGVYTGTIDGSKIKWTGTHPDAGGGTVDGSTILTVASDCNSLTGTASWKWASDDGKESCSGTSSIAATRDNPVGCGESQDEEETGGDEDTLNMFEESLAKKWSRYHGYDDSYEYFIFNSDRTGCYFEITSSGSRVNERSYSNWKLSEESAGATVFDIVLNGSTASSHEFHYATDEIWYGGYSNLDMSPSSTSRTCSK